MDRIEIHGLRVMTVVGALDHEREAAQPLQLDLVLHVDLADASVSDELVHAKLGALDQLVDHRPPRTAEAVTAIRALARPDANSRRKGRPIATVFARAREHRRPAMPELVGSPAT